MPMYLDGRMETNGGGVVPTWIRSRPSHLDDGHDSSSSCGFDRKMTAPSGCVARTPVAAELGKTAGGVSL